MDKKELEKLKRLQKSLKGLYKTWRSVERETLASLGSETAIHIIDFHGNNWIDITRWVSSKYSKEEQMNIVFFQFTRLFKEIHWLQFLFHNANYPMIYRNLRYVLEMVAQACYVDSEYPGWNLDEQMKKAAEKEEEFYGWKLVKKVLCQVLNFEEQGMEGGFRPLWSYLNKHAHPSVKQTDFVSKEDFRALMTDSFNEKLAKDTLKRIDIIFDLIYAMMFERFPRIKELALGYEFINEWEDYLPDTMRVIKNKFGDNVSPA